MSTSSEISWAQPAFLRGNGLALPFWLSLRKQPLAVVHADRPNCRRYTPRSASAVGSSNASTIATVCPLPAVADGSLYADWMSFGPRPAGVASGLTWADDMGARSVRCTAWQTAFPRRAVAHEWVYRTVSPPAVWRAWAGSMVAAATPAATVSTAEASASVRNRGRVMAGTLIHIDRYEHHEPAFSRTAERRVVPGPSLYGNTRKASTHAT